MSIVYQTDKKSGITYAYESKAYWDSEKKQSRSKRTLIGRVAPETDEIISLKDRIQDYQERCHSLTSALARCEKSKEKMKAAYEELLSEFQKMSSISRSKPKSAGINTGFTDAWTVVRLCAYRSIIV